MFNIECHCANIKLTASRPPPDLTDCNCSICQRLGALWAYYDIADVEISVGDTRKDTYAWAEKTITYHRCGDCGCTTHYTTIEENGNELVAINCRMAAPSDISKIPVREFDGLTTWKYLDD